MRLIVNADDFGYSHDVNMAIVEAFEKGYITNTTIMVNMPGFDEAVELSKKYGFFDKVGLHLNLFEGVPLTGGIKDTVFAENCLLTSHRVFHELPTIYKFIASKKTKAAIADECSAQMGKYLKAALLKCI